MASTTTTSFTLPPTPLPHLTFKRPLNFPNPPIKTFSLFPGKFRQPRVFVTGARASLCGGGGGGAVKNNELPSEFRQRGGGRSSYANNDGEGLVLCREELHRILKLLASIMSFVSVDGDPNKGVEERKRELVLQYIASNGGATVPAEEYYRCLAKLLKEWHTDIQEQEQRSREFDFRKLSKIISLVRKVLSWIRKFFHFIGKIFSWSGGPPWFCILLLLCAIGVVLCIFLLPVFLIWKCCVRRPDPPPSPPPINPSVVKNLLPFINPSVVQNLLPLSTFIPSFNPSLVKNLLPLSSVRLATLAIQLKIFIPVMIMVAAVK